MSNLNSVTSMQCPSSSWSFLSSIVAQSSHAKGDANSFLIIEKERNYELMSLASFGGYIFDKTSMYPYIDTPTSIRVILPNLFALHLHFKA